MSGLLGGIEEEGGDVDAEAVGEPGECRIGGLGGLSLRGLRGVGPLGDAGLAAVKLGDHVLIDLEVELEAVGADAGLEDLVFACGGRGQKRGSGRELFDFLAVGLVLRVIPGEAGEEGVDLTDGVDGDVVEALLGLVHGADAAAQSVSDELVTEADADDGEIGGMSGFEEGEFLGHPGEVVADVHGPAEGDDPLDAVERGGDAEAWVGADADVARGMVEGVVVWEVEPAEVDVEAVVSEAEPEAAWGTVRGVLKDQDGHGVRVGGGGDRLRVLRVGSAQSKPDEGPCGTGRESWAARGGNFI